MTLGELSGCAVNIRVKEGHAVSQEDKLFDVEKKKRR